MEQVSSAENIARGESHIWRTRIAECPRGHAYTEDNTRRSPEGKRFCLACKREKAAAYRRAH